MLVDLLPRVKDNEIVVVAFPGWQRYMDLCVLASERVARIALGRLIDYCSQNLQQSIAQFDKISQLNEFNPHGINSSDISDLIMGLGADVYFTCYENRLFELGSTRELPFELTHVGPQRLYLRRLI